jgi:hypothetical protein
MILLFFTSGIVHEAFTEVENRLLNTEHRHILLCAKSIIKSYFTSGRHLLLSLPSCINGHGAQVQILDFMLNIIHKEMRWQVRVVCPDPILNTTPDNNNTPQSYVIFLGPQSNNSDILLDLSQQVSFIINKAFLNRRARFLVVASEQPVTAPRLLALSIFRKLYENYRIVNLVVVLSIYRPDMPHLRQTFPDIDIKNLHVFSWFPNMSYDGHDKVRDVTCSDTSLVEEQRHLFNRGSLSPEKIPIGLQEVPFKLSGYVPDLRTQPHVHSTTDNEREANFSGQEIDFIKYILKTLNLTISYDLRAAEYGSDVNLYIKLLMKVFSGESDMVVAVLPLDSRLIFFAEPTIPYLETPLLWYVPCAKPLGRTGMIFRVLTFPVWLSCAIAFLTVTVTAWLLAKRAKITESKRYTHIASCCYILWSVIVGVSVSKMPQTPQLRFLFLQWIVHCFIMTTVFQAFFTSFLVQPDMGKQVTSLEELLKSGLEYGYTVTHETYIEDIQDTSYTEIKKHRSICPSFTSCVERAITSDFATISTPYLADYILRTKMSSGLSYPICSLPHNIAVYRVSMYLSKGSPLLNPINQIIRRLTESGLTDRFFRDNRNVSMKDVWSLIDIKKRYANNVNNYITFSLYNLHLAFVSLFIGLGVSFVVFLCEVTYPELKKQCMFTDKNLIS